MELRGTWLHRRGVVELGAVAVVAVAVQRTGVPAVDPDASFTPLATQPVRTGEI